MRSTIGLAALALALLVLEACSSSEGTGQQPLATQVAPDAPASATEVTREYPVAPPLGQADTPTPTTVAATLVPQPTPAIPPAPVVAPTPTVTPVVSPTVIGPPPFHSGGPPFGPNDPRYTPQVDPTHEAVEALRIALSRIRPERKVVFDADTIAVVGSRDPHDTDNVEKMGFGVHHIPSLSVFGVDRNGEIVGRKIGSPEGAAHLERVLADPANRQKLVQILQECFDRKRFCGA